MINFQSQLQLIKNLSPRQKLIITLALFTLFTAGLLAGLFLPGRARPTPAPKTSAAPSGTTLTLTPAEKTLKKGQQILVTVALSGQAVPVMDAVINYNPDVFTVSDLTPGKVFGQVLSSQIKAGQVIFSASIDPEALSKPLKTGPVFSFKVRALKKSTGQDSQFSFDLKKTLTAKEGQNTLTKASGAKFKIN